jgi:hypothetical protein
LVRAAKRRHGPFDALMLALLAWLAFLLAGPVLTIPLHIPINYNEGWNAGFDTRAVTPGAGPLYPGPDSLVFDNYPPLGFLIVGAAGRALGDMIVAGRAIALAALLCAAGLTGICVRALGGTARAAAAAALLLVLFACDFYRGYVAMDDPQWLAHALMLGGLALLLGCGTASLRAGAAPPWRVAGAALLMVAGAFVKHNLVALPLATTLWLVWLSRRAGCVWLLAAASGLAAGLGAMEAAFGHAAFDDILGHRRIFRIHLLTHAISRLAPLLPMAGVAAMGLRRRASGDGAVLAALFCGIALVTGVAQRMGEGVYYNAHFETLIALCLAFGLALSPALAKPPRPRGHRLGPASLCAIALLPVLGATPWHAPIAWHDITDRHAREAAWRPAITRLAAADGPVGCLMLSLCAWAGKPFSVDLFNLTQSVLAGGPIARFRAMALGGYWAVFEDDPASFLHSDAVRKLGTDPVMAPFATAYAPAMAAPGGAVLLTPRAAAPKPRTSP